MQEIQGILDNLKNSDWWIRKSTIEKLLDYPEDQYLSVLEGWLRNDDDALIRNCAMEAFRALGKKALGSLISLLRDEDQDIRIFAANLLGDVGDAEALPSLISALRDTSDNVKIASAEALGKIGDERAVDALTGLMDETSWVAMAAIDAIGKIGGSKSLSVLYGCLKREKYLGMTLDAIERAGDQHSIRHITPYVDEGGLRESALKAVVSIAERENISLPPMYFMKLVPFLLELQQSPQHELRRAAFIALCWSEDIRGLRYFIDALNDEELQEYAIKGLISLGKKAVPELIDTLKKPGGNRVVLAKILSMLGENSALLKFADDYDPEVRTEVALAIGHLKTPKAKEVLLMLEQDAVEEVRAAARLSLQEIKRDSV